MEGEGREADEFAAFLGGFVGEDAGAGDVGGLDGIRITLTAALEEFDKLVDEVGVGAAVSGALGEAEVVFSFLSAVDSAGGEGCNFIGEEVGVVRAGNAFWDFGLGLAGGVDDEFFAFDEGPFDAFFVAIDLDGFAVLTGDIEEGAVDEAGEIRVFEFDVAAFDGVGGAIAFVHFFADGAGGEAGNVFRFMAAEPEEGADAVGGVVHGGEAGPVAGPAFHVLLVGGFEKLEFAEFAGVVEFLHEEELAGVDDGLHHHVFEAGGGAEFDDRFAVLDRGRHGDGAGDVLSSL